MNFLFFWKKQPLLFETILIKIIYMYADPTGDQACLWISQPVTLTIIKLDQNQCYISYTIGYQEFLGVTMNMDGSSTTSRILDGSVEVAVSRSHFNLSSYFQKFQEYN